MNTNSSLITAILPAAGLSMRMRSTTNKPYLCLEGAPVLYYSLRVFEAMPQVGEIIVAVKEGEEALALSAAEIAGITKSFRIVLGGETRQRSVYEGIKESNEKYPFVAVHDAARPCLTLEIAQKVALAAFEHDAATAACLIRDTCALVKEGEGDFIGEYVPRSSLVSIQTPQIFRRSLLLAAHEAAQKDGVIATDDTSLVKRLGCEVYTVIGPATNIKLTDPEDMIIAEAILHKNNFS